MPMGKTFGVFEPQVVKKNLGLRAGVMKDQGCPVPADLVQHRRDRVFRAAPGPGRALNGGQHGDIGVRARVGVQDVAGIGVAGQ